VYFQAALKASPDFDLAQDYIDMINSNKGDGTQYVGNETQPQAAALHEATSPLQQVAAHAAGQPEPEMVPQVESNPDLGPEPGAAWRSAFEELSTGPAAFVSYMCRSISEQVLHYLAGMLSTIGLDTGGTPLDSLISIATEDAESKRRQQAVKMLHVYAMVDIKYAEFIRGHLDVRSFLLNNFILDKQVELSTCMSCVFDAERHHNKIKISDSQMKLTSGNGPVTAVSHAAASSGQLTWSLKLSSTQTCCMIGAVKDEFTAFGGTLQPLGWCVDTAGYGGHSAGNTVILPSHQLSFVRDLHSNLLLSFSVKMTVSPMARWAPYASPEKRCDISAS
jgi:hypothetical protein